MEKINLSDFGFRRLQIETKAACNMACSFCPYPLKEDKVSTLDLNEIQKVINQINPEDKNFKFITFSQFNEPLLDNRIFGIIDYAQNLGHKVYFITNGLLLNKKKNADELLRLKPDIKISLQIIESSKHYKGRGLNMDLLRYSKTIFDFCEAAKNKDVNITIDIGCNFNDNKIKYYLRKFFGIQSGDPSVINDKENILKILKQFLQELVKINPNYFDKIDLNEATKKSNFIKSNAHMSDYITQKTFKIANNIEIKIKPFFYGRRISEFYPLPSSAFLCKSDILGILADGSIVPCCLVYDDSIALGNIKKQNLFQVLEKNEFLKNLRKYDGEKHQVCKKCFGEPTRRGVFFRTVYNYIKKFSLNSFSQKN